MKRQFTSPALKLLISMIAGIALVAISLAQSATSLSTQHAEFLKRLVAAAIERTHHSVRYDPSYVRIPYPDGDVPADTGVCSDLIIRTYRAVGVDLQKEVHEDIVRDASAYPLRHFGVLHPDTNIGHRRVLNLMVFFTRNGDSLPITAIGADYSPGDLVTWDLEGNVPHIGIIVDQRLPSTGRYMVVHNVGRGPQMEDVLFDWKITGHYRYFGPNPR